VTAGVWGEDPNTHGARTSWITLATGSAGPYWPPSPQPTNPASVSSLTKRLVRSGKAAWDEKNRSLPSGAFKTKVVILVMRI
jgi:hypothetical protein